MRTLKRRNHEATLSACGSAALEFQKGRNVSKEWLQHVIC
jgi:hypothetical protein